MQRNTELIKSDVSSLLKISLGLACLTVASRQICGDFVAVYKVPDYKLRRTIVLLAYMSGTLAPPPNPPPQGGEKKFYSAYIENRISIRFCKKSSKSLVLIPDFIGYFLTCYSSLEVNDETK